MNETKTPQELASILRDNRLQELEILLEERTGELSRSREVLADSLAELLQTRRARDAAHAQANRNLEARREAEAKFQSHLDAVGEFLTELYAVMVDPLEDNPLTVKTVKEELLAAARKQREQLNSLGAKLARAGED